MTLPEFTLTHLLANSVQRAPERPAIVDAGRTYTYAELWDQASRLARVLRDQGLRRGDRVGVFLPRSWEAVVAVLAVAHAGGVFVIINPQLKGPQVAHIMRNCGMRMLVAEAAAVHAMALPPVELLLATGGDAPSPPWARRSLAWGHALAGAADGLPMTPAIESDLATIIYTSGSTGLPKGIMFSHRNVVAGAQIVSTYLENTPDDRVLSLLPLNFDYGLNQLTTMLRVGGALVLQRSLLPGDILHTLRQERVTGLAGVPSLWVLLLQVRPSLERQPLYSLRYITNSGGTIPSAHLAELRRLLPHTRVFLMYGLTEAFRSTYLPPEEVHRGPLCIGRAIPNTDVWVLDEEGRQCAPGQVGELVHRGPTVALGYWGDPERTRAVYRPNPLAPPELRDTDRVVYSGDLVRCGEDGFLYFVGRRDELIKTQGYRVSPQEVEDLLCSLPPVREAAVFGQRDPVRGQRIVAVVALRDEARATPDDLRAFCAQRAPHYLVPSVVHILPELPRGATGKVDRSSLKHGYARDED